VRGSLEGAFLAFAVGVPMGPVTPEACHVALDLLADALAPWATGTQLLSFAERGGRMRACVAEDALERLRTVKATVDPDGLLLVGHDLV
jgi:hypothetical protein